MPAPKFVAADFGAESGRLILGILEEDKITIEEIHRFPNRQIRVFGHIYWDLFYLFDELKKGLTLTASNGHKHLSGIGVDTWGVDFGLIGKGKHILGNPYAYRDTRTDGIIEEALKLLSREEIYQKTGIQFMQLNTIFQLLSMVKTKHPFLDSSEKLLFMPDLFNFLMTGEMISEYSISSTSQLLDAKNRSWATEIFEKLSIPLDLMCDIIPSGTVIGSLLPEICEETGLQPVEIIAPACHDTASAVAAVPANFPNWAYLSSGTWSLMGIEVDEPIITKLSLQNNFTNEGGVNNKIRFLRNNMGMWLLERCRYIWKQEGNLLTYEELVNLAKNTNAFKCFIDHIVTFSK
jgi:sugar (pentulose or hexulose) kinase